jgi:polyhydroxyalkanoate synthesis regulator phasin
MAKKAKAKTQSQKTAKTAADFVNPSQYFDFASMPQFTPANFQKFAEQLMETSQKNIEAATACAQEYFEQAKGQTEEYANFTTRLFQEMTSTLQETWGSAADPKEKMEEIADCAKYCMEKAANQARKATEESLQAAQKIGSKLQKRAAEAVEEIKSAA